LAEAGLMERSPSLADRRVVYATLTPGGQTLAATAVRPWCWPTRYVNGSCPLGEERFALLADRIGALDPAHQPPPADHF
jgi:DNA-binding MarR family transcriptional regulator